LLTSASNGDGAIATGMNDPYGCASIDRTTDTDGIDVISACLGRAFPHGVFIAQDRRTRIHRQHGTSSWRRGRPLQSRSISDPL
jgi:hypothetical protein